MAEIPNLAGVATTDLVETIGSGSFKASYINWSRTLNLLRQHAPGWNVEAVSSADGGLIHRDPVGGHLMICYRHIDGTVTPQVPQAIMDHRNQAIAYEKITARDVSDTHRRGACLVAAMQFGLAHELWAKMPLESGYGSEVDKDAPRISEAPAAASQAPQKVVTKEDFLEAALEKGLHTKAAEALLEKVGTNYAGGIKTLAAKDLAWVGQQNAPFLEESAPKQSKTPAKKATKPDPSEY
jgi:hypothetical protein